MTRDNQKANRLNQLAEAMKDKAAEVKRLKRIGFLDKAFEASLQLQAIAQDHEQLAQGN